MRKLAQRYGRLGTETAFAVGADAAAWAAKGNTVYPFHLGDMNVPTPDHIMEAAFKAAPGWENRLCARSGHYAPARGPG